MGSIKESLTFDDVLLLPRYSDVLPSETDISLKLTKKISLKVPFLSSAMDTVTESEMAIALANAGGIGIIHRNLNIKSQTKELVKVKKKKLNAGAAIGTNIEDLERAKSLIDNGCDLIVIDTAHGHSKKVLDMGNDNIRSNDDDLEKFTIEFEFNSSNVSLSGKNTELLVNELYAENNGIVVSSMLDSNKEIPIRVKGIRESSDIIGNTGYLSIPAKDGIDFIGNYGQATINKTSSYVTRRNSQRVNQVEGWIWTGTLPHKTEQYLEEKFNEFESSLPESV